MGLIALGINHTTASVDIRERVSLVPDQIAAFLSFAKEQRIADEVVVLSTCNRTELYFYRLHTTPAALVDAWSKHTDLAPEEMIKYLYELTGSAAAKHLFRVAAGLDSLILGEPQIFGQLKQSLAQATEAGTVDKYLNHLFQLSFNISKEIRTKTNIGAYAVSVAFTAVQLARQIFDGLEHHRVLLVGAGETIELVARHLLESGVRNITVANRSEGRAKELIEELGIEAQSHALQQLPELLVEADIVVSSTAADHALITKSMAKAALKARKQQPILMVDLAVPRDIEAEVGTLNDLYLYTVDDLNMIVADNQKSREEAAEEAQRYVLAGVERWEEWLTIAHFGHKLQQIERYNDVMKARSIQRAKNQLKRGDSEEEVLTQLANQLTNRIMHPFIKHLKSLEQQQEQEMLERILKEFN